LTALCQAQRQWQSKAKQLDAELQLEHERLAALRRERTTVHLTDSEHRARRRQQRRSCACSRCGRRRPTVLRTWSGSGGTRTACNVQRGRLLLVEAR
jgi:hypothetical protein